MKPKIQVLLSIAMCLSFVLAACSPQATPSPVASPEPTQGEAVVKPTETTQQKPTTPPEPVVIEWWTVPSEEYSEEVQRKMVEEFNATHPNIKVNITVLPESGFTEKMTTTLGSGQGAPDVAFFWDTNWYPQALDLRPYIERDGFDTSMYIEGFWQTRALWGDVVVGLPLGVGANFVMFNKSVFDEKGVEYPTWDWTTDDYLRLVKELNDPTKKRWGGDRPRGPFRAIWYNYGARPFSDDSTTVEGYLNGPASVAAYTWLWDLVNTNSTPTPADLEVLGTEGTGPVDLFMAGRLAMATLNQGHMLNAIKNNVEFGVVPEPGVTGNPRWVNAWSITVSIWKGTKHPDEAWEFLKWYVGPEGQEFLMKNGNLFPSIRSLLPKSPYADIPAVQEFFKVLELPQVQSWTGTHPCNSAVIRAARPVWDKINLNQIARDQIKAELDAIVPAAQAALDECRARLGQ